MATAMIKISLLLQYLRVFEQRVMRSACLTLLGLTSVWTAVFAVLVYVPCSPPYAYWDITLRNGGATCWGYASPYRDPFVSTFISHASINMLFDIIVLFLPVVLLWKSNSTMTTKLSLLCVLCVGSL